MLAAPYDPLLPSEAIRVDTTDIGGIDIPEVGSKVTAHLRRSTAETVD